jgi:hypothetical protein
LPKQLFPRVICPAMLKQLAPLADRWQLHVLLLLALAQE